MRRLLVLGGTGGMGDALRGAFTGYYHHSRGSDVDLRDEEKVRVCLGEVGPDDIVCLAVRNHDGGLHKQTAEEVKEQVEVTCIGAVNLLRVAVPYLRAKGGGSIVFGSSILSTRPVPGAGIYAAGKAFLESLVQTAAIENAKYGIRVNAVRMGYFEKGLWEKVPPAMQEKVLAAIPLGRLGRAEELADAIRFLLTNGYVTGTSLTIAGGL